MRARTSLSYVDIIIMAIVLGTVAVAVGPQFTKASTEDKVCSLVDGLELMRTRLDLYRAEHRGCIPPVDSFESFKAAMTTRIGRHGPYIEEIPANPFNRLSTVRFDGEPAGSGRAGWRFNTKTGSFKADNEAGYAAL